MIRMTLHLEPVAQGRPRVTRFGTYTPGKSKRFKNEAAALMRRLMPGAQVLTIPLKLTARFVLKRPKRPKHKTEPITKPDTDNYLKALMDAANGILWADDSQVVHVDARKLYDQSGGNPRIEIEVSPIQTGDAT